LFGILKRTDKGASLALVNDAPRSARATIERSDLTEALGNVLDNAVRYAKTTVRVSCQGDSEPLAIVVEDDAPGIAPNLEAIIRQRGGRLDEKGGPRPIPRPGYPGRLSLADGLRILHTGRSKPAAREGAISRACSTLRLSGPVSAKCQSPQHKIKRVSWDFLRYSAHYFNPRKPQPIQPRNGAETAHRRQVIGNG